MSLITLPFAEWLPDLADKDNPGSNIHKNVLPSVDGPEQFLGLVEESTALNTKCLGAVAVKDDAGVAYNYAGTTTKLYSNVNQTWTDVTRAGDDYTVDTDDFWEFVRWGSKVIAVGGLNADAPPQIITLGGANFTDLGGTPPRARHIGVVRNFVVMGNVNRGGTAYPNEVDWSGINDETQWGTSASKQSDFQALENNGGNIQKVVGGEYGVIFQEHTIARMDYIGPPFVFSFDETLPGYGTPSPNSVVQYGDRVFYLDQAGFKVITQGRSIEHIGHNKVDDWFFSNVDNSNLLYVIGAVDKFRQHIWWIFPTNGTVPDYGLVFDLKSGHWSYFEERDCEWIYNALGVSTDLESLDTPSGSDIDALSESLDSRVWMGGAIALHGFSENHKSGTFSGDAKTAELETTERQLIPGQRAIITRSRPEIETTASSLVQSTVKVRSSISDLSQGTGSSNEERDGSFAHRAEGRYHRFFVRIFNGFTKAQGVAVEEMNGTGKL